MARRGPIFYVAILGAGVLAGLLAVGWAWRREQGEPRPAPSAAGAPAFYRDMTEGSGIDFTYRNGEEAGHYAILESLGGGVALLDYDGDGLLDIFVPGGGYFDGPDQRTIRGHPGKLYRNRGGWRFEDVTATAMPDQALFFSHGGAAADYDCDGWVDLLVTGWGRVALYHNEPVDAQDPAKGRQLIDRTARAGLHDKLWSTSAAWGDLDGDGFPELYICHYVDWSFAHDPTCAGYSSNVKRDVCPPLQFNGLPHVLYRNNADGTFTDVSASAGLRRGAGKEDYPGKGLGVVIADVNADRRPDIYVTNDTVDSFLYLNRGHLKLEEVGRSSGVAIGERGVPQGSMGVDVGDYDESGLASIFVTNYENETHALYRNLGKNDLFLFSTAASGIASIGQRYVGFGTRFLDVDSDGLWDLVISNGHVIRHPQFAALKQRPILFRNQGKGRFADVSAQGGSYFAGTHRGRGLAVGDLDNDGRPDLVFSHVDEPIAVLRNVAGGDERRHHWLGIALAGKGHRDTVGSRVTVTAGGRDRTWFVRAGGSYLSSSDPRPLFGLAEAATVDRVVVDWSYGATQEWAGAALAVDRYWELREQDATPRPLLKAAAP